MSDWINFFCLVLVQIAFLGIVIRIHPDSGLTSKQIVMTILTGTLFGIVFDLIIGKYAGVYEYRLGFGSLFMMVNGILSFGAMAVTIAFLRKEKFWHFYMWTVFLGIIYEIANHLFPVWKWSFVDEGATLNILVIFCAYFGLSSLIAVMLKTFVRLDGRFAVLG